MSNRKASSWSVVPLVVSGLLIAASVFVFSNQQQISDQFAVWSYQPGPEISSINSRAGFTKKGTFTFYATSPALKKQDSFNKFCPRQEEGSPILGCYTADDSIYIYDVTHPQLDGMKEVTAIHEMLHAVWARTDAKNKKELISEIRSAYSTLESSEITERMKYYERTEPDEINNELHSILGTEVASLSPYLEGYYSQYFDREAALKLHAGYSDVYRSLNAKADELYQQMEALASSISSRGEAYDASLARYSADVASFNQRADSGWFSSQSQFYNERYALVARQNSLEITRQAINQDVDTYNRLRLEYEAIANQVKVLNDSLDSMKQVEPAPAL